MSTPGSWSRGTLYPDRLPPRFRRIAVEPGASRLATWVWISQWDQPDGEPTRQHILGYPACNLVVEPTGVGLSGPATRASHRDLEGTGWAVGLMLRPAAVADLVPDPAALLDRYVAFPAPDLHAAVAADMARDDADAAAETSTGWLARRVGEPNEEALLANAMVDLVAAEPAVRTVADVADRLSVSIRTVHRLARRYVGLTPYAMIRRRRLQEAAQAVRDHPSVPLGEIAATHGFSDQAHLAREFRTVLGFPAGEYREAARAD